MADYKLIGHNYQTPDLVAKVTGRAKYAEDYRAEGMLFVKLLLSPMPHARVRKIDASAALKMPGVFAVLTADELPDAAPPTRGTAAAEEEGPAGGAAAKPKIIKPEMGLTNEPVFQGEPILAVAAVDEFTAAEAIERITVDLEPLPRHAADRAVLGLDGIFGHQEQPANDLLLRQRLQPSQVGHADPPRRLRLDRGVIADHEIDFMIGRRAPIPDRLVTPAVPEVGAQLHRQPLLEAAAVEIGIAVECLRSCKRVRDAGVEEIELGRADGLPLLRLDPSWEQKPRKGVLEEEVMLAHGRGRKARVASDLRKIEHPTVGESRRRQKPGEGREAANEAFGLDFFMQVGPHVGVEFFLGVVALNHRWKPAVAKEPGQVEARDLGSCQRVEVRRPRAAPEQIGLPSLELPGAAAREHEAHLSSLDQTVDLVEQRRELLDFVDHDGRGWFRPLAVDERLQQAGIRRQTKKDVRTEQIDDGGAVTELLPDEEALPCRARSQQEEGLLRQQLLEVQDAVEYHCRC